MLSLNYSSLGESVVEPPLRRKFNLKCRKCGRWNRIDVDKLFVEQPSVDPKVMVFIPMYRPLKNETCTKCGGPIAEEGVLICRVPAKIASSQATPDSISV